MRWNKNGHRILTYAFFEDQNTMVICKDFKYYLEHIKQIDFPLWKYLIHSFTFLLAFLACVIFQELSKFKLLQAPGYLGYLA